MTQPQHQRGAWERVRFDVHADGTVEGDDGFDGTLAAALRYSCRMGAQIGTLLGLGELERVSTQSNFALMARVVGGTPEPSIRAEVEVQGTQPPVPAFVPGVTAQEAIDRSLRLATIDLACDWSAIITDDGRLVGAMHDESLTQGAPEPVSVHEVGVRALAILASLDDRLRESCVRLDFVRGSVLVASIGPHALFAHADKFDAGQVISTVAAVQGLLVRADLVHASPVTGSRRA